MLLATDSATPPIGDRQRRTLGGEQVSSHGAEAFARYPATPEQRIRRNR